MAVFRSRGHRPLIHWPLSSIPPTWAVTTSLIHSWESSDLHVIPSDNHVCSSRDALEKTDGRSVPYRKDTFGHASNLQLTITSCAKPRQNQYLHTVTASCNLTFSNKAMGRSYGSSGTGFTVCITIFLGARCRCEMSLIAQFCVWHTVLFFVFE